MQPYLSSDFSRRQLNREKTSIKGRNCNLHRFRQKEHPLELPCRNAAMKVQTPSFVFLPSAYDKLLLLLDDLDLIGCKARDGQSDAQPRSFTPASGDALYVVGGIAIGGRSSGP